MIPDLITPVVGVKTWTVRMLDNQPMLGAMYNPDVWPTDRPLTASCSEGHLVVPDFDHTCGIHAWGSDYMLSHDYPVPRLFSYDSLIYGEVKLTGRVVRHRHGWRAERAAPSALFNFGCGVVMTSHGYRAREVMLDLLSEYYDIPVIEPEYELKEGCECPLCRITRRGYADFDLLSILPPDE